MTAGIHRKFDPGYRVLRGTRWRGWLSRKVAGSIPDGVIGIFFIDIALPTAQWPWGDRLGLLTEMGTRNIF